VTTGLDQAICEWWKETPALLQLVPVDRVAAEIVQAVEQIGDDDNEDGHFEDCVVFQIASEPHYRTNSGQGWKSAVKFSCFSIDYDKSKAIAQAVSAAWNNTSFTGTGSTITLSRFNGLTPGQDETTGVWDHTASFEMNHTGV
jgi:hypothetical protein